MKLKTFLYILIRDEITIGKIESIMQDLPHDIDGQAQFSCSQIALYVDDLAERLSGKNWQEFQDALAKWAVETFGVREPGAPIQKMRQDLDRLSESPHSLGGYADIGALWLEAAAKAGYRIDDLFAAMVERHEKKLKRPEQKNLTLT
jgi:hypothetical protein